jgi:hypothetical protein
VKWRRKVPGVRLSVIMVTVVLKVFFQERVMYMFTEMATKKLELKTKLKKPNVQCDDDPRGNRQPRRFVPIAFRTCPFAIGVLSASPGGPRIGLIVRGRSWSLRCPRLPWTTAS